MHCTCASLCSKLVAGGRPSTVPCVVAVRWKKKVEEREIRKINEVLFACGAHSEQDLPI